MVILVSHEKIDQIIGDIQINWITMFDTNITLVLILDLCELVRHTNMGDYPIDLKFSHIYREAIYLW